MANKVSNYVKQSYDELMHKVSWPTWPELQNSAVVVFIAALIIAVIVFIIDITTGAHPTLAWKGILGYLYSFMK